MGFILKKEIKKIITPMILILAIILSAFISYTVYRSTNDNDVGFSGEDYNCIYNFQISVDLKKNGYSTYYDVPERYDELKAKADKIISDDPDLASIQVYGYYDFMSMTYRAFNTLNGNEARIDGEIDKSAYCDMHAATVIAEKYEQFYGVEFIQYGYEMQTDTEDENSLRYIFRILQSYEEGSAGIRNVKREIYSEAMFGPKGNTEAEDGFLPFVTYSQVQRIMFCFALFFSFMFSFVILVGNPSEQNGKQVLFVSECGGNTRKKAHLRISVIFSCIGSLATACIVFASPYKVFFFRNEKMTSWEVANNSPKIICNSPYNVYLLYQIAIIFGVLMIISLLSFGISEKIKNKPLGIVVWLVEGTAFFFGLRYLLWDVRKTDEINKIDYLANFTKVHNIIISAVGIVTVGALAVVCFTHAYKNKNKRKKRIGNA